MTVTLYEASEALRDAGLIVCRPSSGASDLSTEDASFAPCAEFFGAEMSHEGHEGEGFKSSSFYFNISGAFLCMITASLAAGLTMGLLSIDGLDLAIKSRCGTDKEKRMSSRILPLISKHHLLLVTLLLMNACANEALPLFLDKLVPSYIAITLSVTIVLFFGEILPSAIFTGPRRLEIACALTPLVRVLMTILLPVTYPIARTLDYFLGHDEGGSSVTRFSRRELAAIVQIQYEEGATSSPSKKLPTPVNYDELQIISGALTITSKTARDAMVKIDDVYAVEVGESLTDDLVAEIYSTGHSRIPVYVKKKNAMLGFMLMKNLVCISPADCRSVSSIPLRVPLCFGLGDSLRDILNSFQEGGSHIALVCSSPSSARSTLQSSSPLPDSCVVYGIITLEDVIEELLQEEIRDETDNFEVKAMARAKKVVRKWKKIVRERKQERERERASEEDAGEGSEPLLNNNNYQSMA